MIPLSKYLAVWRFLIMQEKKIPPYVKKHFKMVRYDYISLSQDVLHFFPLLLIIVFIFRAHKTPSQRPDFV